MKVVFRQRSSSIKRLSSIKGSLPSKVVFHLPSLMIFHEMLSSINGNLSSKVILHQQLSFIKGDLGNLTKTKFVWQGLKNWPPSFLNISYQISNFRRCIRLPFTQLTGNNISAPIKKNNFQKLTGAPKNLGEYTTLEGVKN